MTRYILRRSIQSLLLIWLSTVVAFSIYQFAPGGPLQFLERNAGGGGRQSRNFDLERMERLYGLDRNVLVQYLAWMTGEDWMPQESSWRSGRCLNDPTSCGLGIMRLDFGRSFYFKGEPVLKVIVERVPATFLLGFASLLIALSIGIPLGVLSAMHRGGWIDNATRMGTVLLSTVPDWWLGLLLLIILGGTLGVVPLSGMYTIGDGSLLDRLHHLFLPALVLAVGGLISFSRFMRFGILDVLGQDYVRTAHAKGLARSRVMWRHVLRNAILPLVTGLSSIFLLILDGAVLFELVFSWPGMGRLAFTAISSRDYPVMMALFVISSFLGILGVLMVDILYGIVDPRVKYDERRE